MKTLPRSFYRRNTLTVAKELLGKYIIRKIGSKKLIAKIVETEAYLENDPASHSFKGVTPRNSAMFGHPGRVYVYFIYGVHYCLNFVTEKYGKAGAVLIRAVEPVQGIKLSTNGPGKLTKAMKIDKSFNGADLIKGSLTVASGKREKFSIIRTKRIGISKAKDKKYRFYIKGNAFISKP